MKIFKRLKRVFSNIEKQIISQKKYIIFLRKQGVQIGNGCFIDKSADFGVEPYLIKIGNDVRITQGVKFITHDGGLWVLRNLGMISKDSDKNGKIQIGNNVNIGWNVIILPGVTIGDNCVIGAGAVVTKDISNNSVVAGVPAKYIEDIDAYCSKIKDSLVPTKYMDEKQKREYLLERYK